MSLQRDAETVTRLQRDADASRARRGTVTAAATPERWCSDEALRHPERAWAAGAAATDNFRTAVVKMSRFFTVTCSRRKPESVKPRPNTTDFTVCMKR